MTTAASSRRNGRRRSGRVTSATLPRILGRHRGVAFYTIGQRRGLGIADTTPYYVVALRPEECEVIVGKAGETYREECRVTMVNWVSIPPPREPLPVTVKIRYTAPAVPAVLEPAAGEVRIRFAKPQRAVTPGQAAVTVNLVLGGGLLPDYGFTFPAAGYTTLPWF